MKVIHQTPDKLIMRHRNRNRGAACIGCGLFAILTLFTSPLRHSVSLYFTIFIFALAFEVLFSAVDPLVILEISQRYKQLTLRRCCLLGMQTIKYPLNQIVDVVAQQTSWYEDIGSRGPVSRIAIVLKDGKKIVVHSYDRCMALEKSEENAALIRRFIGR
ncbi:MAG: hypothetical protein HC860_16890 [Alkalinema sp. RU_4_3]|nr:hypothetical protein [Alkalinema sp. RU_4_3]